jgi:hypothetical protein
MARPGTSQHFLYLSLSVWGEAKRRAVVEASTASKLLNRLLDAYLEQPLVQSPRQRTRSGELLEIFDRRSAHLENTTWTAIKARAEQEGRSVSAIAEQIMRQYLGMPPLDVDTAEQRETSGQTASLD